MRLLRPRDALAVEILMLAATREGDYCPTCRVRLPGDVGYEIGVPTGIVRGLRVKRAAGLHRHAVSCPRALATDATARS